MQTKKGVPHLEHGHQRRFGLGQVDRRSRSDDELHDGLRDGDDRGRRLLRRKLVHQVTARTSLTGLGGTDLFAFVLAAHDLSLANNGVDRVEDVVAEVGSRLGLAHREPSADLLPDKDRESVLEVVLREAGEQGQLQKSGSDEAAEDVPRTRSGREQLRRANSSRDLRFRADR
jgi:hypothetical protein